MLDVQEVGRASETALILVAKNNHREIFEMLLKEGAGDAPLDGHALHLRGGVAQELDQVLAHLVLLVR